MEMLIPRETTYSNMEFVYSIGDETLTRAK